MILAMAADALQIFVFPLFAEGALYFRFDSHMLVSREMGIGRNPTLRLLLVPRV